MKKVYAIEMEGVWFSYDRVPVLKDVSFKVERGDFLGVLGPNGGGKTTLLKLVLGILKPERGRIRVLGQPPQATRNRVGYLPQSTDLNLTFPISVLDVALMGCLNRTRLGRRYRKEDRLKAEETLEKVGMQNYRHESLAKLSGGQRQRVLIARALLTEPEILLLDEPTSSVDPEFEISLFGLLKELNRKVTILLITHDVGVISSYVKSVACINRTLVFHEGAKITKEMIDAAYECPVDLIAHGMPHRVFQPHKEK